MQTALEAAVQLEAFPRAVVDVYCVVMESGGSDLPVLITTAALALADAGIPLYDLVTACSIVRLHNLCRKLQLLSMLPSVQTACCKQMKSGVAGVCRMQLLLKMWLAETL